jgi:hypothetical protein
MFAGLFADIAAPVMASHLSAIFDEIRPDVVVHEVAELGVTPIATSRGVRRIVVAFAVCRDWLAPLPIICRTRHSQRWRVRLLTRFALTVAKKVKLPGASPGVSESAGMAHL